MDVKQIFITVNDKEIVMFIDHQSQSYIRRFSFLPIVFFSIFVSVTAAAQSPTPRPSLPSDEYFTAVADTRNCASPKCGGAWVSQVDSGFMQCPDGRLAKRCYVLDVEFNANTDQNIKTGKTLIHGKFEATPFVDNRAYFKLVADAAYVPLLERKPDRGFYALLTNTGHVCITDPCPTLELQVLNLNLVVNVFLLQFDQSMQQDDQDFVRKQAEGMGALIYGQPRFSQFLSQGYIDFTIYNAYKAISTDMHQVCGGLQGTSCPSGEYCNFEPDGSCGLADQTGVCLPVHAAGTCPRDAKMVCACDGKMYPNRCEAARYGQSVMNEGPCRGPLPG